MKGREKDRISKKGGKKRNNLCLQCFLSRFLNPQCFVKTAFQNWSRRGCKKVRNHAARMRIFGKSSFCSRMPRQWLRFLVIGLVVRGSMLSRLHHSFTRLLWLIVHSAVLTHSLVHSLARSVVCVLSCLLTHSLIGQRYFYAQYLNCIELLQEANGWCR